MRASLTIGDFSRATHLSAKALRLYHESGLLTPASVDPHSGYRLYAPEQLADARIIRTLRGLDVPVGVIRGVLTAPDVDARAALISGHLERMEARLDETRSAVRSLRGLLDDARPPIQITHRSVPETLVVAITETIELADLGTWFQRSVAELTALADGGVLRRTGPYGGAWSTELFLDERGLASVHVPVQAAPESWGLQGRAHLARLPPVELAVATHRGPDETVPHVYTALGEHVTRHELSVDGPIRESYLEGFPGTDTHAVTEIGWPIFRISR